MKKHLCLCIYRKRELPCIPQSNSIHISTFLPSIKSKQTTTTKEDKQTNKKVVNNPEKQHKNGIFFSDACFLRTKHTHICMLQ